MRPREYRRAKAPQRMLIQPMARLRYPAGWAVVNKSLGKLGIRVSVRLRAGVYIS